MTPPERQSGAPQQDRDDPPAGDERQPQPGSLSARKEGQEQTETSSGSEEEREPAEFSPEILVSAIGETRAGGSRFEAIVETWKARRAWNDGSVGLFSSDLLRPHQVERKGFRWSSVIETLILAAAILIVSRTLHPEDFGYLSVYPHPFWVIIILISIRYVFKESMVCALIAAAVYSFFVVFPARDVFHFSAINLFSDFKDPLLFLITAGFISGFTQHLFERTEVLRSQVRERDKEIERLHDQNEASTHALRRLEARIAGEFTNILDLFEALSRTKQMSSDQIKHNLLEVLKHYLNVEQSSYYDVERDQLVRSHSLGADSVGPADHPPEEDLLLTEALRSEGVAHLGQFARQSDLEHYQGASLMAGALRNAAGHVIGLVSVESMPFIDYNPHSFKLFQTILEWWSAMLDERMGLEALRAKSVFDDEVGLYNYTYFAGRIAQEFERVRRFSLPLSLALVRIDYFAAVPPEKVGDLRLTLARIINEMISELEMASCYKSDALVAITFPIMMATDAEERMKEIIGQIDAFDFHPYQDSENRLSLSWATADYEIGMESHEEMIDRMEQKLEAQSAPE